MRTAIPSAMVLVKLQLLLVIVVVMRTVVAADADGKHDSRRTIDWIPRIDDARIVDYL